MALLWDENGPTLAIAHSQLAQACNRMDVMFEPHQGWDAKAFEAVQTALMICRSARSVPRDLHA